MKRIGMDKKVDLEWLDFLAFRLKDNRDYKELRGELEEYLQNKIRGSESRRKYGDVHMRIWVSVPVEHEPIRDRALSFLSITTTRERLALHWGMCLLAFNLFRDVTGITGKLFTLNDEITQAQVHNRIIESWGDRSTLKYAVQRMIRSMAKWGVLVESGNNGSYKFADRIELGDKDLKLWLLECYLSCIDQKTVAFQDLNNVPALFPFTVNVGLGDLLNSGRFEVNRQGLDVYVVELR